MEILTFHTTKNVGVKITTLVEYDDEYRMELPFRQDGNDPGAFGLVIFKSKFEDEMGFPVAVIASDEGVLVTYKLENELEMDNLIELKMDVVKKSLEEFENSQPAKEESASRCSPPITVSAPSDKANVPSIQPFPGKEFISGQTKKIAQTTSAVSAPLCKKDVETNELFSGPPESKCFLSLFNEIFNDISGEIKKVRIYSNCSS